MMVFYGDELALLENPFGDGYIAGTNEYGDVGKYQRFDVTGGNLTGFKFYFGKVAIVGEPEEVSLVVRSVGGDGAPADLLTELIMTTAELREGLGGNLHYFPEAVELTGPVFLGFEIADGYDDTLALYSDPDGLGDGANRAWELFNDGSYNDFGTTLNPSFSWDIDVDLWIAALFTDYTLPVVSTKDEEILPTRFELGQNYPNPFNPNTTIELALPEAVNVELVLYNILGQQIATLHTGEMTAGLHRFHFDGSTLSSGLYFYRVTAGEFNAVRKMMLVK
jgi:hypothetical protein